jgi:hypothetical protein
MEKIDLTPYFAKKIGSSIKHTPDPTLTVCHFEVIAVQHSQEECQTVVYFEVTNCTGVYMGRAAVGVSHATTVRSVLTKAFNSLV